jgi:tetratricopeptide (TPR) repeat protein
MIPALTPALLLLALAAPGAPAAPDPAHEVEAGIAEVERLLGQWQFDLARALAERTFAAHPDLPAVQFMAGWMKFQLGESQAAADLIDRAAAAFGDRIERDPRVALVRNTARLTRGFVRDESPDKQVVVQHAPGVDQILVPYLFETVTRTLTVVGEDLGYRVPHPIVVQILPDTQGLADSTGLTAQEIDTSGTIAVCKFGKLMIVSPRATLKGFGWLDTASHELVHLIISEKTLNQTPIWLHEALARYEDSRWRSGEPLFQEGLPPLEQSLLAGALAENKLITFEQMHPSMALLPSAEAAELAFAEVYMVARFLLAQKGYAGLRALLDGLREGNSDLEALQSVYGWDQDSFVRAWTDWLKQQKLITLSGQDAPALEEKKPPSGSAGERALVENRRVDLRDLFHLGQLLRARGRSRASVLEYQKAADRAGPNHAAVWMILDKLGLALLAIDRLEPAAQAFRAALKIQPMDLEAHLYLARVLQASDPKTAWLHLREALRINPLDPRVQAEALKVAKQLDQQGDDQQDWKALAVRHQEALKLLLQHGAQPEGEPAEAKAPEAVADQGAALRLLSRPWARVWLDYRDTGLTTPVVRLEVSAGFHVVGLVVSCLPHPVAVPVLVPEGQTVVLDRELCPAAAAGAPAGSAVAQ